MLIPRTEAELQTAIETMFRVRAVESPPDDQGARTIWHRGHKGADLVTWVDAFGRVTRQELYLFADCLIWEKTLGVRTGEADRLGDRLSLSSETIAFDVGANDVRIGRARKALGPYTGADKFILHARSLVGGEQVAGDDLTRTARAANEEQLNAEQTAREVGSARQANGKQKIIVAVCILAALLLVIWIIERV